MDSFPGDGALSKITKIRLPKILNLVHFFKKLFLCPVKHQITSVKLKIPEQRNVVIKPDTKFYSGLLFSSADEC